MSKFVSLGDTLINVCHVLTVSELKYPGTGNPYVELVTTIRDKHGALIKISAPGTLEAWTGSNLQTLLEPKP